MIKEAIVKLSKKEDLTYQEAETVMDEIMSGQATAVQMSSYLTALSMKGETIDEITASAAGMRAHCIKLLHDLDVLEIVGTGGDGPILSIFPLLLHWLLQLAECRLPNMETVQHPQKAVLPMYLKHLV